MEHRPPDGDDLLRRAGAGDPAALGSLLEGHRRRLRRMVKLRLDPRLQGRIDPSDVLQEAYLEASRRLAEYLRDPKLPFFLWLRFLTGQKLLALRRQHLGTQARDAGREVSLFHGAMPEASSACLAAQLMGKITATGLYAPACLGRTTVRRVVCCIRAANTRSSVAASSDRGCTA